ncbi:MAG: sensor domain-containing diguanylate cyclase [Pseudomonadota bacterium]
MGSKQDDPVPDDPVYKTLLESTKAIPWRIDWKSMQFTYIGPQIEQLLGWKPETWVNVNDWAERMHPDDRDNVVNFCVSQSQSGIDHEADYRALTRDGGYVWIRDVVHVVRRDGEVEALVGFMFDISERKKNEEEVKRLQRELESVSFRDSLTDLPNHRMFELVLERELASARRSGQPVSLVLVDIDFFASYNSSHGPLAGDECLRRVARLLTAAASRPRDFVARQGGEEFALILPETDAASAQTVAERCRRLVVESRMPHPLSGIASYVTVSAGVVTRVPNGNDDPKTMVEAAGRLLAKAKEQGRNCVRV